MKRLDKNSYFMNIAIATSKRSTCMRKSVGCVLVDINGYIAATGYNGVPKGVPHCSLTNCIMVSPTACNAIHAEQNALMQCKDINQIEAVYTTLMPCFECSKMIANTSVKAVYYKTNYRCDRGINFLKKCNIEVIKL